MYSSVLSLQFLKFIQMDPVDIYRSSFFSLLNSISLCEYNMIFEQFHIDGHLSCFQLIIFANDVVESIPRHLM